MDIQSADNLGVQLYFDETSYRTMFETGEYCRRSNDFKTALEAAGFERHKTKAGMIYTGLRLGVEVL